MKFRKVILLSLTMLFILLTFEACSSNPVLNDPVPNTDGTPATQIESTTPSPDNNNAMPSDFNFSLNYGIGGVNKIDTYEGSLTKDLIVNGTETINFIIPPDKMQEIFTAFMKYEIPALPDDINADTVLDNTTSMYQTPANHYTLSYTLNEETKTIVCDDGGSWNADSLPETRDRLVAFVDFVREYINGTEEYKNMSPTEGGYA